MRLELWKIFAVLWLGFIAAAPAIAVTQSAVTFCAEEVNNVNKRDPITGLCPEGNFTVDYVHTVRPQTQTNPSKPLILGGPDYSEITKAIVAVHGGSKGAPTMFRQIENDGGDASNIWVVAPMFWRRDPVGDCRIRPHPGPHCHCLEQAEVRNSQGEIVIPKLPAVGSAWSHEDEKEHAVGGTSVCPVIAEKTLQVSSFDVLDHIVRRMKAQAPNLREVVMVGFSAGSRAVDRWSLTSSVPDEMPSVRFRYLSLGMGSHFYFNDKRYSVNETTFVPSEVPLTDPDHDRYPFGLRELCSTDELGHSHYEYGRDQLRNDPVLTGSAPGRTCGDATHMQNIRNRFMSRTRLYLVGELDNETYPTANHSPAELSQGPHRRARAFNYLYHLRKESLAANTGLCVIKDIWHDGAYMTGSHAAEFFWRNGEIDCSLNDENCPRDAGNTKNCPTKPAEPDPEGARKKRKR